VDCQVDLVGWCVCTTSSCWIQEGVFL